MHPYSQIIRRNLPASDTTPLENLIHACVNWKCAAVSSPHPVPYFNKPADLYTGFN